jgi:alkylation response protein AidB-like acyl-CoA dehydrogenase
MLAACVRARASLAQRALSAVARRGQHAEAASAPGSLDDAAEEFRDSVHEFAQREIAPHAEEIDRTNAFPKGVNLWTAMGDFGLHGAGHKQARSREAACSAVCLSCSVWARPRHHRSGALRRAGPGLPASLHRHGGARCCRASSQVAILSHSWLGSGAAAGGAGHGGAEGPTLRRS